MAESKVYDVVNRKRMSQKELFLLLSNLCVLPVLTSPPLLPKQEILYGKLGVVLHSLRQQLIPPTDDPADGRVVP